MASTLCENSVDLLISDLKDANCCARCVLRYLNEKRAECYKYSSNNFPQILEKNDASDDGKRERKIKKLNTCSTCLGLLEDDTIAGYFEKIVKEVQLASYDCDEVTFALSLPISLILRNHSTWLHLSEKFRNFYTNQRPYDNFESFTDEIRADGNVVPLKEAWKILVAPDLAQRIGKQLNNGVDSKFHVTVNFKYPDDGEETACMAAMHPNIFADRGSQKRKYHNEIFTRKSVESALDRTSRELFIKHSSVPPPIAASPLSCTGVSCSHDSIYVAGRYNKFSRMLSQTPWVINGERRMESSVEELISAPIAEAVPSDVIKFSSSGREDVDVRTLGSGRPFVLDVQNPHRIKLTPNDFKKLQGKINASTVDIQVRDLQLVPREDLVHIKAGERLKTKTYNSVCVIRGHEDDETLRQKLVTLSALEPFVIQQRTPVRVLHRRPLASRPRTVHWVRGLMGSTVGENTFFTLKFKVEAGTYIKELVHGDLGRTIPSISSILGLEADIIALDVEAIDLEWPPVTECTEKTDTLARLTGPENSAILSEPNSY